jgi:hypothetical protein
VANSKVVSEWLSSAAGCIRDIGIQAGFVAKAAKEEAERIRLHLRKGEVYAYDPDAPSDPRSRFLFVQAAFHAYLDELHTLAGDGTSIVARDNSGDVAMTRTEHARLRFDPRGGTRVSDWPDMRAYLRIRNALLMTLWDMAIKSKPYSSKSSSTKLLQIISRPVVA